MIKHLFLFFLISISFASALDISDDSNVVGVNMYPVELPGFDNSTGFVNNSVFWQGYEPSTLPHNVLDNLEWSVAGHTWDENVDLGVYDLTTTGNVSADWGIFNSINVSNESIYIGDVKISSNIEGLNVSTNVTSPFFVGDGSQLTNLNLTNISFEAGNITAINITANGFFFGNGSQLTDLPSPDLSGYVQNNTDAGYVILADNVTSSGIVQGEQLTSTDDLDMAGVLTNVGGATDTTSIDVDMTYTGTNPLYPIDVDITSGATIGHPVLITGYSSFITDNHDVLFVTGPPRTSSMNGFTNRVIRASDLSGSAPLVTEFTTGFINTISTGVRNIGAFGTAVPATLSYIAMDNEVFTNNQEFDIGVGKVITQTSIGMQNSVGGTYTQTSGDITLNEIGTQIAIGVTNMVGTWAEVNFIGMDISVNADSGGDTDNRYGIKISGTGTTKTDDYGIYDTSPGGWALAKTNKKLFFGNTQQSSIYFGGLDLVLNPKETGAGKVRIDGDLNVTENITGFELQFPGARFVNLSADSRIDGSVAGLMMTNPPNEEVPHFWIQSGGSSQASGVARSFMIVNEEISILNNSDRTDCQTWADHFGKELMIDCNTTTTGADLLVGDDMQVFGTIYTEEYEATAYEAVTGTLDSGFVENLSDMMGEDMVFNEVVGGFDIRFNVTGLEVEHPKYIVARWGYDGGSGHEGVWEIYDYDSTSWKSIRRFTDDSGTYTSMTMVLPNNLVGTYVEGGVMQIRAYHGSPSNTAHDINVDYVGVKY